MYVIVSRGAAQNEAPIVLTEYGVFLDQTSALAIIARQDWQLAGISGFVTATHHWTVEVAG